ncbi:hypothetical protein [Spirosoma areae]
MECADKTTGFSPGAGDMRITGVWQLVERGFVRDSIKSVPTETFITRRDSVKVQVGGQTILKDTLITERVIVNIRRDTSFYRTQRYPASPPQTLAFETDGKLIANGPEMTYYSSIKHYRVDTTYPDSLGINFFIGTNGATVAFRQGLAFRRDTLLLLPRCEQKCYSKFVRVK